MKIKELKQGQQVRVFGGTGSYIVEVIRVVTDMTHYRDIAYVKNANGKEGILTDNYEFELRHSLDPTKWLEKAVKDNSEKTKSVLESGLGVSKSTTVYNQSNDLQQRKRNKKLVEWSDDIKLKFIERVIQDLSPLAAFHIGNAIDVIAVAENKEDIEQARWSIQRAYENWDK